MRKLISLLILFVSLSECYALQQERSVIKGIVTGTDAGPLQGATVIVVGTNNGAVTDSEGMFTIYPGYESPVSLKISFIGYEEQLVESDAQGTVILNVVLQLLSYNPGEAIISAVRAGAKTPVTYTNVSRDIIEKNHSGQDIPFLLGFTPSLVETSEAGTGIGYTSFRIRGSDASRINVTIDGIPLNDAESQQVFWVDLPDLASSADNIQVQRGAGTSTNGAGAFGATISLLTSSPEKEPSAKFSASVGSFGTRSVSATASTGMINDKYALQVRLSDMSSNGYIRRTASDHSSAFISGIYRTSKLFLKSNIALGKEKTGIGWWGVPQEMLLIDRRFNPAGAYTDGNGTNRFYENETDNYIQNHFHLMGDYRVNGKLSLSAALHYTSGEGYYEEYRDESDLSDYGLDNIIIGSTTIEATDIIRQKWLKNGFYGGLWGLKYKSGRLEAVAGGAANIYEGNHFGTIEWMRESAQYDKGYEWYRNSARKSDYSVFAKAQFDLTSSLSLYGDLQFRNIGYTLDGLDDDLRNLFQDHRYNFFNPKAGLFLEISEKSATYLSFAVAGREPTRQNFKDAAGDNNATPRPEKMYDTEAGYRISGENYAAEVNLFAMTYKDQLIPTGELSDVGYPVMTNVEKSRRIGAELSGSVEAGAFLSWKGSITLSSNRISDFIEYYSDYNSVSNETEYKSKEPEDSDIAYSPSVTAWSDFGFNITEVVTVHFVSKYVSRQYFDNTMSNLRTIDPYGFSNMRFDITPAFKKVKELNIQLFINNIFNSVYESNAYGGNWYEDGVEKSWAYFYPQAGRNFMAKITLEF